MQKLGNLLKVQREINEDPGLYPQLWLALDPELVLQELRERNQLALAAAPPHTLASPGKLSGSSSHPIQCLRLSSALEFY